MSPEESLVRRYLDHRPRPDRYAAAFLAVNCSLYTWERWAHSLGDDCPRRILKGPIEAQEAAAKWLAGELDAQRLAETVPFAAEAWRFASALQDPYSQIAAAASASLRPPGRG